jgi:NAD(P)-dependent dehydrogenase (short-subunit alcohol dehydrogenase family)
MLVIGGGSSAGRAAALAFAQEGADVVIADAWMDAGQETVRMIRDTGGQAVFVQADLSRPGEAEAMIERAIHTYGRVDCALDGNGANGQQGLTTKEIAEALMAACSSAARPAGKPWMRS